MGNHRVSQLALILIAMVVAGEFFSSAQTRTARSGERDTAFALEQQGRITEAESVWQEILKSHPDDAEAYAHLGFLESRQGRFSRAVSLYRKASALSPAMPGLRMNLGLALFKAGDLKGAIQALEPLLRSEPADSSDAQRLRVLLGMAHYGLGQDAAAVPYLKEAMARDPQNLPYRLVLAQSCLRSRQYRCVLDVYHQILLLNAESAEADMLAGEALDAMQDHAGAIQQFQAAVRADPRLPNVHFGLGYLLWCQTQYQQAAEQFQAELENTPGDVEAMVYLADADVRLNRSEPARQLLAKIVHIDSRLEMTYLDLGILDADAGQNEQALSQFRIAARLNPADVQVHWRLGRLYQAMGRRAEAKAEFDRTKTLTKAKDATVYNKLHGSAPSGRQPERASNPSQ